MLLCQTVFGGVISCYCCWYILKSVICIKSAQYIQSSTDADILVHCPKSVAISIHNIFFHGIWNLFVLSTTSNSIYLFHFFVCQTVHFVACSVFQHCFDLAHGYRLFIHLLTHSLAHSLIQTFVYFCTSLYIFFGCLFVCLCLWHSISLFYSLPACVCVCECAILLWLFPSDNFYQHFTWWFRKWEFYNMPKIKADFKYNTIVYVLTSYITECVVWQQRIVFSASLCDGTDFSAERFYIFLRFCCFQFGNMYIKYDWTK